MLNKEKNQIINSFIIAKSHTPKNKLYKKYITTATKKIQDAQKQLDKIHLLSNSKSYQKTTVLLTRLSSLTARLRATL